MTDFKELAKRYEDLWRQADAEKKQNGKISAKTRRELEKTAEALNA